MMDEQKEREAFDRYFEVQGNYSSAWDGWLARAEIAEADRRDAERYREIRRINMKNDPCFSGMTEEEFDANTDAAIKESK